MGSASQNKLPKTYQRYTALLALCLYRISKFNGLPFVTATKVICGPFENCKMLMVSRMQFLPNFTEIKAINFLKLAQ